MNASSIDTGSTSGVSSSISARTSRADRGIFLHVRPDDGGVRAQPPRLEHRHRRAHAEGARDVAGGQHDAALAAADDHRLVGERGIVALLDGGVEGVAIDMGDRRARRAPDGAAAAASRRPGSARLRPARRGGSRGRSRAWPCDMSHPPLGVIAVARLAWRVYGIPKGESPVSAARARMTASGSIACLVGEGEQQRLVRRPR